MCKHNPGVTHEYAIEIYDVDDDTILSELYRAGPFITLEQHSTEVEMPDPALLEMHACIAKILHLSGRGEKIDQIITETEQLGCLSEKGGSNLHSLLLASFDVSWQRKHGFQIDWISADGSRPVVTNTISPLRNSRPSRNIFPHDFCCPFGIFKWSKGKQAGFEITYFLEERCCHTFLVFAAGLTRNQKVILKR